MKMVDGDTLLQLGVGGAFAAFILIIVFAFIVALSLSYDFGLISHAVTITKGLIPRVTAWRQEMWG